MRPEELLQITGIDVMPRHRPDMAYECIGCGEKFPLESLLYVCPACENLLGIVDRNFDELKNRNGSEWRRIFDLRRSLNIPAFQGIFLFHELIMPNVPLEDIIYLGEGCTPLIKANQDLSKLVGTGFYVKNDGQNPSASFKDRGMACAISFLNHYIRGKGIDSLLGICASTGDTSAAAALYLSHLSKDVVKSAVLLPKGKVTPQQLSQPLGSGAQVIEIDGVFDDCMKIVEILAEEYDVFLLNSKNPIRINGQKSFAFEIAQQMEWDMTETVVVVPIGNAGNITAILTGFLDLQELGLIDELPHLLGVQSERANPVAVWKETGKYEPMAVKPSVAQAAMIGNPISFPKVRALVEGRFEGKFNCLSVSEQEIMDAMLIANRHGHVVCTQGGETIAGLKKAINLRRVNPSWKFICDSTSHQLKFAGFQEAYFSGEIKAEYGVEPRRDLVNKPKGLPRDPQSIADYLGLKKRKE